MRLDELLIENMAADDEIDFHKISLDFLQASSEATKGRLKTPITQPGHPTAIGVSLILDLDHKDIQFFEMNSALKGYGGKMVDLY